LCYVLDIGIKRLPASGGTPTGSLTTRRHILLMADQNPTDRGSSGPTSIAREEAKTENAVLSLLLDEHPIRLTLDEVALVLHAEPRLTDPEDAAERAVYRLACFGLIYRDGRFLTPTRAATRFEQLRAD
jgi:hypothetical protein